MTFTLTLQNTAVPPNAMQTITLETFSNRRLEWRSIATFPAAERTYAISTHCGPTATRIAISAGTFFADINQKGASFYNVLEATDGSKLPESCTVIFDGTTFTISTQTSSV